MPLVIRGLGDPHSDACTNTHTHTHTHTYTHTHIHIHTHTHTNMHTDFGWFKMQFKLLV